MWRAFGAAVFRVAPTTRRQYCQHNFASARPLWPLGLRTAAASGLGLSAAAATYLVRQPGNAIASCEGNSDDIHLVQYNILAPRLANPEHYLWNKAEQLDPETRFRKIVVRLEEETVKRGAIVGLQEVDLEWAGRLHAFFAERGYVAVFGQYGKPFNNYMGVMLAWPREKYQTVDVEISRISDTAIKGTFPKKQAPPPPSYGTFSAAELKNVLGGAPPGSGCPFDEWQVAKDRANEAIFVRLQHRGHRQSFVVSTYHMPCLFGDAAKVRVMNIHTHLLVAQLARFSRGDPAILLGDFNFKPDSSSYLVLAAGGAFENAAALFPEELKGVSDRLTAGQVFTGGLDSAYRIFNDKEPDFTNYARSKGQDEPFCDTLDYIWFTSRTLEVIACPKLPVARDKLFPSDSEPSDHLPLYATMRLKSALPAAKM